MNTVTDTNTSSTAIDTNDVAAVSALSVVPDIVISSITESAADVEESQETRDISTRGRPEGMVHLGLLSTFVASVLYTCVAFISILHLWCWSMSYQYCIYIGI